MDKRDLIITCNCGKVIRLAYSEEWGEIAIDLNSLKPHDCGNVPNRLLMLKALEKKETINGMNTKGKHNEYFI